MTKIDSLNFWSKILIPENKTKPNQYIDLQSSHQGQWCRGDINTPWRPVPRSKGSSREIQEGSRKLNLNVWFLWISNKEVKADEKKPRLPQVC